MLKLAPPALALLALAACSDTDRARQTARFEDRPADILCVGYGGVLYDGRSTGRIEFDETGRINFVDAASGRLMIVEGECRVAYARPGAPDPGPEVLAVPPTPRAAENPAP